MEEVVHWWSSGSIAATHAVDRFNSQPIIDFPILLCRLIFLLNSIEVIDPHCRLVKFSINLWYVKHAHYPDVYKS